MKSKHTSASKLFLARSRFQSKNWYTEKRFNRLAERMRGLNAEEKQLVIELTDKFDYIGLSQFISKIKKLF